MAAMKSGDRVKVVSREVTGEDEKTGQYYSYFGGLTGTVDRIYDDRSVCVDIDTESLEEEMRKRHLQMQEAERKRWLANLSGEMRSRLTGEQRQLTMSYKLLVSKKDLEPHKGGKPKSKPASEGADSEDASAVRKKGPARAPDPKAAAKAAPPASDDVEDVTDTEEQTEAKRLSESDLAAKEEEYLRSLRGR